MSVELTGQRLGHYLVQEVIGRGGMSVVYRGVDERLQRSVALKVMSEHLSADPEFRSRFLDEARAASAIDHVNVVPLYDFGESAGRLFIAMRLVNGTDLARELAAGPMPPRRVLALLTQVGAALDMLHDRGLVHLDVKPANVLITRNESAGNEHAYLADFGLTRRGPIGHRTASGDFLGSPTYASPEHLRGEQIVPGSDEYSLTCMLFTALAGRPPYVGDVRTVVTGHLSGMAPSLATLSDLPPSIDRVIARGLAADPAARYSSSADLISAARRAIADTDEPPPVRPADEPAAAAPNPVGPHPSVGGAAFGPPAAPAPGPVGNPVPGLVGNPVPGLLGNPVPGPVGGPAGSPASSSAGAPARSPDERSMGGGAVGRVAGPGIRPTAGSGAMAGAAGYHQHGAPLPAGYRPPAPAPFRPVPPPYRVAAEGRRPASHRIEPARARWPWFAGAGVLAVLVAVVLLLAGRARATDPPRSLPTAASSTGTADPGPLAAPSN